MKDKITVLLEKIDPSALTPEIKGELTLLFEEIEKKVESSKQTVLEEATIKLQAMEKLYEEKFGEIDTDHTEKLERLVESIDADHTKKLERLVESIDADHTEKLERLVESIDADHTEKLQKVIDYYEEKYETTMVEKVSDYLDTYLEEVAPENDLVDTIKYRQLNESVQQIRKLLAVNDEFVQTEVKEAIEDAKLQLEAKNAEINELMTEKINFNKKLKQMEAEIMLESKVRDLPLKKQRYVKMFLENVDPELYSEKIEEACEAFDADENRHQELLIENKSRNSIIDNGIPETSKKAITEDPMMETYVRMLNKTLHARK